MNPLSRTFLALCVEGGIFDDDLEEKFELSDTIDGALLFYFTNVVVFIIIIIVVIEDDDDDIFCENLVKNAEGCG